MKEKRERERERERERDRREREAPVCAFKTPACVRSKRLCVYRHHAHMFFNICAWCRYTRRRFERAHADVLNAHTGVFQRDTPHPTTSHAHTTTTHTTQNTTTTPPQHITTTTHHPHNTTTTNTKTEKKRKKNKNKRKKRKEGEELLAHMSFSHVALNCRLQLSSTGELIIQFSA